MAFIISPQPASDLRAILLFCQPQKSAQPANDTHPARDARAGTPVIAHRFIGCVAYDNESQSVKRTTET